MVFQMVMIALRFAPKADPPLKPIHPNHNKEVPRATIETYKFCQVSGEDIGMYANVADIMRSEIGQGFVPSGTEGPGIG